MSCGCAVEVSINPTEVRLQGVGCVINSLINGRSGFRARRLCAVSCECAVERSMDDFCIGMFTGLETCTTQKRFAKLSMNATMVHYMHAYMQKQMCFKHIPV
jgi:hypothetical protein